MRFKVVSNKKAEKFSLLFFLSADLIAAIL